MKIIVRQPAGKEIEINTDRFHITCGDDHYQLREQPGDHRDENAAPFLLVRLEEHAGKLAQDLAVIPNGGNSVRLKGLR